jgi:hypothetical protein
MTILFLLSLPCWGTVLAFADVRRVDGYRGIWFDLGQTSDYGSKYSGGLGTYTAKHRPLAIYSAAANKTFFVYGGTTEAGERHLLAMVSYYDHATGRVPRPVVVHDKVTVNDPHDNPSLGIDDNGYLWIFVSGRGRMRPGFIYRSRNPYRIDGFERRVEGEFTYPQPCWIEGRGFLHLFTKYTHGRELYWNTCDLAGQHWSADRKLAGMGGHYQMTEQRGRRVITAFNMHPGGNVDKRTNLYFVQTTDRGHTWKAADGTTLQVPLTRSDGAALVRDYRAEGRLVYLKDIVFDTNDQPVLLYVTSGHHQPGPDSDPRRWTIARWTGSAWRFHEVTCSTHNYDMGSLYIEAENLWRIIAPTEPGPQHWGTGGEVAIWQSTDQGQTWTKERQLTAQSERNHAYVRRPVHAQDDFYAFWADGNPDHLSRSCLTFTNKAGTSVKVLPYDMNDDFAEPIIHNHP